MGYRYSFQGQEKDDEIKGTGNSVNYKYRMHDPRLGRFFAVDPLYAKYPHNSPYAFSENEVIAFVELEGLEKAPSKSTNYTPKPFYTSESQSDTKDAGGSNTDAEKNTNKEVSGSVESGPGAFFKAQGQKIAGGFAGYDLNYSYAGNLGGMDWEASAEVNGFGGSFEYDGADVGEGDLSVGIGGEIHALKANTHFQASKGEFKVSLDSGKQSVSGRGRTFAQSV